MYHFTSLILAITVIGPVGVLPTTVKYFRPMDAKPNLPYDPNTTSYCTWWIDYNGSDACKDILASNWIELVDFRRWNPSIKADCSGLQAGKSYCVEALFEPKSVSTSQLLPQPTSTSKISVSASKTTTTTKPNQSTAKSTLPSTTKKSPSPTSTKAGNGIQTPTPTQPQMVNNCDKFYFVKTGDTCQDIATQYRITLEQFLAWNPKAGKTCTGLWADAYACVSIIGHEPTGIQTPSPIQTGMVKNCKKFDFVAENETCDVITKRNKISLADFIKWNPAVGSDCRNMWAKTYVCVGV